MAISKKWRYPRTGAPCATKSQGLLAPGSGPGFPAGSGLVRRRLFRPRTLDRSIILQSPDMHQSMAFSPRLPGSGIFSVPGLERADETDCGLDVLRRRRGSDRLPRAVRL